MKRIIHIALASLLFSASALQAADPCLEQAVDEMNALYRTGEGCEDEVFNAVGKSMVGWGIGLFIGIALLTGLVPSSTAPATTTTNTTN